MNFTLCYVLAAILKKTFKFIKITLAYLKIIKYIVNITRQGVNKMTYAQAKKEVKKDRTNKIFTGDAGNGCTFKMYFCQRRQRVINICVLPDGTEVM